MAGPSIVLGARRQPVVTSFDRGCDHVDLFSQILERLSYEGTACFDYKVVDGKPLVFEINPRYGGSLSGDVTAYLDAYVDALT
jgi:predicted ATP-grasp superfamily ATP-dependent carboligase